MSGRRASCIRGSLRQRLRATAGSSPEELREQVVELVREVARAPVALFYAFCQTPNGLRMARNTIVTGETDSVERLLDGIFDEPGRYVAELPDATRASDFEMRAFVETQALWRRHEDFSGRRLTRELYIPHGLGDQIRLLACDGDRPLGWVGAFRYRDQPSFREADRRRLAPYVDSIGEVLAAADAMDRAAAPRRPAFAVGGPDGQIELVSPMAPAWLKSSGHVAAVTRQSQSRAAPFSEELVPLSAHVGLSVIPLEGREGSRRLLRIEPLDPPRRRPDADLSSTQRCVAEFLLGGATQDEIARQLGCSRETVRSHVRTIYVRLGVNSTIGLLNVLSESRDR